MINNIFIFIPLSFFLSTSLSFKLFFLLCFSFKTAYLPIKSKLQHPPRANPRAFEFLENFVQIPPSPGRKAVQMPQSPGKLPDYCFNFSVASIMLLKLYMLAWFIRQHMFTYYRYKSFVNTFKYGTQLV